MRTSAESTHFAGPRALRLLLVLAAATAVLLAAAASARADSITLAVLTTSGESDPVGDVSRIFAVSGVSSTPQRVYVKYRPAGGAACAPTADQDTGRFAPFSGFTVNGNFDQRMANTWSAGTWVFCMWIAEADYKIANPVAQTITFRAPSATVTATIAPGVPVVGQAAAIHVVGNSEAPRYVYVKVRPAGAPCAQTYDGDTGETLIFQRLVNGLFGADVSYTFETPGSYVICLWVANNNYDTAPVAGPQPQPVTVIAPTPVISSAQAYNCSTGRRVTKFRVQSVPAVCLRYSFSVTPLSGTPIDVTFVRPGGRTHSRVRTTWLRQPLPLVISSLQSRSYKHRRGTWKAVLRIGGVVRATTSFRVKR